MTSPSSTGVSTSRAARASTISGRRSVTSSSVRVKRRTVRRGRRGPAAVCRPAWSRRRTSPPSVARAAAHVGCRAGQHRPSGAADLQRQRLEGVGTAVERGPGDRPGVAGEHDGPAHRGVGDLGRIGDGLEHDPVAGALAGLSGDEAAQPPLLVSRGSLEEVIGPGPSAGAEPDAADARASAVAAASTSWTVRLDVCGRLGQRPESSPADPEAALRAGRRRGGRRRPRRSPVRRPPRGSGRPQGASTFAVRERAWSRRRGTCRRHRRGTAACPRSCPSGPVHSRDR